MTTSTSPAEQYYAAAMTAARAGNTDAADRHWRSCIGELELRMGRRTHAAQPLTPAPVKDDSQS